MKMVLSIMKVIGSVVIFFIIYVIINPKAVIYLFFKINN